MLNSIIELDERVFVYFVVGVIIYVVVGVVVYLVYAIVVDVYVFVLMLNVLYLCSY